MTGPLDGKTYPASVMMPIGTNSDEWVADVASYVRNSFGNRSPFVTAGRRGARARRDRRAQDDVDARGARGVACRGLLLAQPSWKVTASHNRGGGARRAHVPDVEHGAPQQPGMWFQVELPRRRFG